MVKPYDKSAFDIGIQRTNGIAITDVRVRLYNSSGGDISGNFFDLAYYEPTSTSWVSPTGWSDPDSLWASEINAYDNNTATAATEATHSNNTWGGFLNLTHASITISHVRYYLSNANQIDIDLYYNDRWNHLYSGTATSSAWTVVNVGAVVGMMLRHDKNDVPEYKVYDRKNLADQFFTGVPNQQYQDPEEELPIIIDSWRSGFGLEVYDSSDPERYRTSNGMDMRHRGMMIAGPKATAISLSGLATGTVATHATFNSVEYMSKGASLYKLNATGDGLTLVSARGATITALEVFGNFLYVALGNAMGAGATLLVSADTEASTTASAYTKVKELTAIHNGTLTVKFDLKSGDNTVNAYGKVYRNGAAVGTERITTSLTYVTYSEDISGWNEGDLVQVYAYSSTGSSTAYVQNLRVYGVAANAYEYMNTSEAFTASTATVANFKYFKTVDAAAPTLWGSDSVNTIRSTTNPVNGGTAWSGVTTVDTPFNDITGLFSDSGLLYVDKEDVPYYLNSSGAVKNDLAPEMATFARSTDNGKRANWWLHNFYMPWGSSLLEEDGGVLTWRSPNDYSTQLADFVGTVFAVAGDDHYLFAIIDNSTKIEVLAGRKETIGSTTKWVWHPINETTLTGCENCWVSAIYQKRLWISSTATGDSLYYIPLPIAYGNVLADANRAFLTGVTMETPWLHGGFRSETKAFIKETLEMGHTYDADIYFTTKYKLLEDTAWTTVGNYTGSATSMIQSRYIPVDASANKPTSTMLRTQITAVTDDTTKTPTLLSYTLRAVLYPTKGTIIACKVRCAKEITLRDGGTDLESDATIIATLDEARTATYPITIYDLNGDAQTVKMLSLPSGVPYWLPISNEKDRSIEREYNCLFQIVPIA